MFSPNSMVAIRAPINPGVHIEPEVLVGRHHCSILSDVALWQRCIASGTSFVFHSISPVISPLKDSNLLLAFRVSLAKKSGLRLRALWIASRRISENLSTSQPPTTRGRLFPVYLYICSPVYLKLITKRSDQAPEIAFAPRRELPFKSCSSLNEAKLG